MQVNDYEENYTTGWIKMYRSFVDWEWYTTPNMIQIFIHCLLKANHRDNKWKGILVKRGSFITSLETLKNETGLTYQNIRTCLKRLEKSGEINKQSNKQHTLITICKYDTYQAFSEDTNKQANKQLTNVQQTPNKRLTTNNNDNNIKNEKNDERSAYDFLILNQGYVMETFVMNNKKNVVGWDRMIDNFNDTVEMEKLEWDGKVLFARLRKYCRNWISNQNNKPKTDKISF